MDLVSFSRLFTVRADGTKMRPLGLEDSAGGGERQSDGGIVDWMTGSEGRLLMARTYVLDYRTPVTLSVERSLALASTWWTWTALRLRPSSRPETTSAGT